MEKGSRQYGYVRVSTEKQNTDRQYQALLEYGVDERNIVEDKVSGKDFNRDGYILLKTKMLRAGDSLVIKELDRLGRDKKKKKKELQELKEMNVFVRVLDIPTTLVDLKDQQWVSEMVTNILIEVMGSLATQERLKIHQRQAEGIAIAKASGKHLGRPFQPLPADYFSVMVQVYERKLKGVEAQSQLGLGRTTYFKLKRKYSEDFCRQQVELQERGSCDEGSH